MSNDIVELAHQLNFINFKNQVEAEIRTIRFETSRTWQKMHNFHCQQWYRDDSAGYFNCITQDTPLHYILNPKATFESFGDRWTQNIKIAQMIG
jgi:hypothetical protein